MTFISDFGYCLQKHPTMCYVLLSVLFGCLAIKYTKIDQDLSKLTMTTQGGDKSSSAVIHECARIRIPSLAAIM